MEPVVLQKHHLDCVLYTSNTTVAGRMETTHGRVSDALNLPDTQFLAVTGVSVRSLFSDEQDQVSATSVMIRRSDAILVALAPSFSDGERPASVGTMLDRAQTQLVLEVGPFTVQGIAHVPAGGELLHYVTETPLPFVAVTDATVTFQPDPATRIPLPFVMVNRQWIRAIMLGAADITPQWRTARERTGGIKQTAPQYPDERTQAVAEGLVDVLLRTKLFLGADGDMMAKVVRELGVLGGIARKQFYSGSEVFREGDYGDSLFVVAGGNLEVVARDSVRGGLKRLGTLGPGDVFGEMALLGENRRTASVVGTSAGHLYEIKEDALKQLLSNFPSSANTMLRLMIQRRGPTAAPLRHLA